MRTLHASTPNRKWIADFTYVLTAEGWFYVAAVIDLFSRRVVGWSMSAAMTAQLVTDALVMAIWRRRKSAASFRQRQPVHQRAVPEAGGRSGFVCSMSHFDNVWDNAVTESFFSSLKTERVGAKNVPGPRRGESQRIRPHRALLQPQMLAFDDRIFNPMEFESQVGLVKRVSSKRV